MDPAEIIDEKNRKRKSLEDSAAPNKKLKKMTVIRKIKKKVAKKTVGL